MTLHFVGETIDKRRAHGLAQSGEHLSLVRGVYAEAAADVDHALLAHAVRSAHHLYPAALSILRQRPSARPTAEGQLFSAADDSVRLRSASARLEPSCEHRQYRHRHDGCGRAANHPERQR